MSLFHPQIVDARGKRLALLGPLAAEQRRRRWEIHRRRSAGSRPPWCPFAIAVAVLLAGVLSGLAIPALLLLDLPLWLVVAIVIPLGSLPGLSCLVIERHMFASRYRDAYIGAGMCPSCGYDLLVVAVEVDESRVCPECGGAWRVE